LEDSQEEEEQRDSLLVSSFLVDHSSSREEDSLVEEEEEDSGDQEVDTMKITKMRMKIVKIIVKMSLKGNLILVHSHPFTLTLNSY